MRIWSLHPRYLDRQGLIALWRETLLAKAVLRGETRGYRHHPQLQRFQAHASPRYAINAYLQSIYEEACARGYAFDRTKVGRVCAVAPIVVTTGQLAYEWQHLLNKLASRSPECYGQWISLDQPECHPLFRCEAGGVAEWERVGT